MLRSAKRQKDAPFRVTIHDDAGAFRLKLEGRVGRDEAAEVEARWRTGASTIGGRAFQVDLSGATALDAAAEDLLERMRESGAELIFGGPERRDGSRPPLEGAGDSESGGGHQQAGRGVGHVVIAAVHGR